LFGGAAWRSGLGLVVDADGDDLFYGAHREALGDYARGQSLLGLGVGDAQQGAGVAGAENACRYALLDRWREVQQAERVADVRARTAYPLRELFVSGPEVIEELLVSGRFFEWVELLAVQVLDEGVTEKVGVRGIPDDSGDFGETRPLGCAPPALSHYQLVLTGGDGPDDHGLEESDFADRVGEFLQGVLVKGAPGLARVGRYRGDRHLQVPGAGDVDHLVR
jgi:hypothetical protein